MSVLDDDLAVTGQETASSHRKRHIRELTVSAEVVMVLGVGMCLLGFITKMMWWTFGGVLLFYMGVMALPDSEA